ncbi:unnamed protein product [Soboliphyme baturini]|uniref:Uncharacterized protein n=1 Tax=Soboliphyme baturini TaxID=241478 RepID=A0A183J133_9BILA|nr:unnamed protein product [Soboliphyme baturini]
MGLLNGSDVYLFKYEVPYPILDLLLKLRCGCGYGRDERGKREGEAVTVSGSNDSSGFDDSAKLLIENPMSSERERTTGARDTSVTKGYTSAALYQAKACPGPVTQWFRHHCEGTPSTFIRLD